MTADNNVHSENLEYVNKAFPFKIINSVLVYEYISSGWIIEVWIEEVNHTESEQNLNQLTSTMTNIKTLTKNKLKMLRKWVQLSTNCW